MIHVVINACDGFLLSVREHSRPQVCAATSAITCGLVSFLLSHKDRVTGLRYTLNSGDSSVSFDSGDSFIVGGFEAARIAFLSLQKGYPEDIRVTCDDMASLTDDIDYTSHGDVNPRLKGNGEYHE